MSRLFTGYKMVVVALIICLLCGCEKGQITPILTDFKCNGTVSLEKVEIAFEMQIFGGEIFELTVTSPPNIAGLKFCKNGDKKSVCFDEITVENEKLGTNFFAESICEVFESAKLEGLVANTKNCKISSKVGLEEYTLSLRADGFVTDLEIKSTNLTASFKDFKYIKSGISKP